MDQESKTTELLPEEWIREIESAFAPYPQFVQSISEGLFQLAARQGEMLEQFEGEVIRLRALLEKHQNLPQGEPAPSPKRSSRARPEKRLLLVDDAEVTRVLMAHYLKGLPVKIDYASNLDRALGFVGEKSFDLLVVDFELGGQSPESLLKTLKACVGQTKVLALSPNVFSNEEESRALGCGFDLYLARSLPKESVIEKFEHSLWG